MKQSLEQVWNPQRIMRHVNRAFRNEYRTVLKIVLNRDGSVASVRIISSSSIPQLDDEAVEAVKKAAPYVNPPKELVEADGRITIQDFHFIVSQRYVNF
jgi:TonB family protein